jgi:hypothetical protein
VSGSFVAVDFTPPVVPNQAVRCGIAVTFPDPGTVHLDDLRLTSSLFADGFESGSTSSWSSTQPPP